MLAPSKGLKTALALLAGTGAIVFLVVLMAPTPERLRPDPPKEIFPYREIILASAREFDIDPHLIAAVIKNESAFNPRKVSPDGAVGLMQVMPATGRWGAAALQLEDYSDRELAEPAMNVRIGTWYLSRLLDQFQRDLDLALAAYNAGPGRLQEWQRTARWDQREGLDRIPVMETRSYVLLVRRDLRRYRSLSANREKATP